MAVPFTTSSVTLRARSASDASDIGPTARARIIAESTLLPSPSPHLDVSPIRRGARNTWAAFFATKQERKKTAAIFDTTGAPPEPIPPDDPPPKQPTTIRLPKVARKRISSPPPANPSASLGRSFTGKPRPLSRIEGSPANSPTFPEVFASLPAKTRERIRSSYDSTRRSHERPEFFTLGCVSPAPEIPDPDTPTPTSYSVRASTESRSSTHIKRRTMASFARPPITSPHSARRISALPLHDELREAGEFYRASTADLSDFLRATGPEDSNPVVSVEKLQTKDVDRDGANSIRSRTRSSIFRIGGRKREKSRHNTGRAVHTDDVPPLPAPALPHLPIQDDRSFSPILPMLNLNDDSAEQSARSSLQSSHYGNGRLPPNTREHRLKDGTTILMITTPQTSPEAKILSHSRSLGSMTSKDEAGQLSVGTSHRVEGSMLQSQPYSQVSYANTTPPKHKVHSPTVSMSSDGTLSTYERQRIPSGEGLALLSRIKAMESTVTPQTSPSQPVSGRSISMGAHGGYLQTPKTRPRGYSSPEPVSPPSAESTPTISTPLPAFSPSASIAPTPELTPHKFPLTLPESIPVVTVVPPRKHSPTSPIIVDGLHFPAPPSSPPRARRRPNTMDTPPLGYTPASPTRTSRSMRTPRNPRNSGLSEADSIKARTKKFDSRPSPLNLDAVPTYRHWKLNPAEVHIQPGELTGLELDLNSEQPTSVGKKRQSLMEQHQQLFLNANPFQTPPSPSEPFLGSPLKTVARLPLESGPPAMPLPPSPRPFPNVSMSTTSPISLRSSIPNELRHSTPNSQRTRFDSLMIHPPALITPIPASPVTSDASHALTTILTAQREQFDGINKYLIDMVKTFEDEKRAYEQRIQELTVAVNEKEAKAKEDERKIKGLEWLVGNLNLRAGGGKVSNGQPPSDSGSSDPKISRRRGSFSGLGAKEDIPMAPLPIDRALDPVERAKRAASMDDVLQNLVALSESGRFTSVRSHPNIYEWAANTALEQD
ncbi:unnamed protein product [Rhizoctonia solani]|uniref:Uncharacterized protein n=3 Tax=Rhizoctonia solani TaxID=456999 RepID=A0A8H3DQ36_9AGAM|nr:hypothetical protein RSOL_396180 [Rhizoctonia solani AG-3 Rhs1AP]KEP46880.1 hypothetical protein V565_177310 [Rhizoctonia solani 123E]CAE6433600.1 unnamed protein product [Rhizoctonia solani]CAE6533804.1 unnamed protein product [Rhizoctonia solani]